MDNNTAARFYVVFAKGMQVAFPNLEAFNWRALPLEHDLLQLAIGTTPTISAAWIVFFFSSVRIYF